MEQRLVLHFFKEQHRTKKHLLPKHNLTAQLSNAKIYKSYCIPRLCVEKSRNSVIIICKLFFESNHLQKVCIFFRNRLGDYMKNVAKILWCEFKEFLKKYCFIIFVAILLWFISIKCTEVAQTMLQSIASSLIAVPIVFLCCDFYIAINTRKQRQLVEEMLNKKLGDVFLNFLFMSNKLLKKFDEACVSNSDLIAIRKASKDDLFNCISSAEYNGYFLFSIFDDYVTAINELLESPLFVSYTPNRIKSLMSEFSIHYQNLLSEFQYISLDDFIHTGNAENIVIEPKEDGQYNYPVYTICQQAEGKKTCIYIAGYRIFDEAMLNGIYRISGKKAKDISITLSKLYSIVNTWEKMTKTNIDIENYAVASGRLCKSTLFNCYAHNNVAVSIQWY